MSLNSAPEYLVVANPIMSPEEYIRIEQSKALAKQLPTLLVSTLAIGAIIAWVMWNHFSQHNILLWMLALVLVAFGRWWTTRVFTVESATVENSQKRLNVYTFWFVMNGLNWGVIAFLFHDVSNPLYTICLTGLVATLVSTAVSSSALFMPAFLGFSMPVFICFFTRLVTVDENPFIYQSLSVMAPFFFMAMTAYARLTNRNFKSSKQLEYDNAKLLNEVTLQKNIAETAVLEKNQFLSATSHDLRQPLHAMGLYIDALKPRLSDALSLDILGRISQSGGALNDLLHGLLDISRLDASMVESRPQHFYLSRITEQLFDEFESQAQQRELDLRLKVDQKHVVYADPILLERVLRNLLSNALKYTEEGTVSLSSEASLENIEIRVDDSGIGIPESKFESIFSEFTQLGNPERDRNKGLGLGLAIVKRLCNLQDIPYRLESELGKGTSVSLLALLGDKNLCPLETKCEGASTRGLTILFVDDEQAIREGMQLVISSWQCTPLIAAGKRQALEMVQDLDHDLDIIVSDLRLREHDTGIELVRQIREELNNDVPAIIVTGDTAIGRLELTKTSNALVMHKPIKTADLREQIERLLSKK